MNTLLPNSIFAMRSENYLKLKQLNFKGVDERILESLKLFGDLEGVVPIFSCSGHTPEEQIKRKNTNRYDPFQRRYIMFVVNEQGKQILNNFDQWCESLTINVWRKIRPKIIKGWVNNKLNIKSHFFSIEFNYVMNNDYAPEEIEKYWNEMIHFLCINHRKD